MPTYEYRCDDCGYDFETVQGFNDEPLTVCPKCGSPVRKVFSSVGIVFKGSGFYSTDSHHSSHSAAPTPAPATDATPSPKPEAATTTVPATT